MNRVEAIKLKIMSTEENFEYKENSYFEEGKEYTFKASTGIFKSKVVKARNAFYYTLKDGVNESERGIFKASSILVKPQ